MVISKNKSAVLAMITALLVLVSMFAMPGAAQAIKNPGTAQGGTTTYYAFVKKGERMYVNVAGASLVSTTIYDQTGKTAWLNPDRYTAGTASADGVWRVSIVNDNTVGGSNNGYTFDIRVVESTLATIVTKPGRVWMEKHGFEQRTPGDLAYWGVSDLGYVYKLTLHQALGYTASVALRSAGPALDKNCDIVTGSLDSTDGRWNPGYMDCGDNYRLFLEDPRNAGLPEYSTMAGKTVPVLPKLVSNADLSAGTKVVFEPNPGSVGGIFKVTTLKSFSGTISLKIDANGNGSYTDTQDITRNIVVNKGVGIPWTWNGKTQLGGVANSNGKAKAKAVVERVGEAHFMAHDFEGLGGITMTRLNGTAAPNSTVYWDDRALTKRKRGPGSTVSSATSCLQGCNSAASKTVHGWKNGSLYQDQPNSTSWGDGAIVDNWAYAAMGGASPEIPIPMLHNLKFVAPGGSVTVPNSISRTAGLPWGTVFPTAKASNMIFEGWAVQGNPSKVIDRTTIADGNYVMEAKFSPAEFNVVFDSNVKIGTVSGEMPSKSFELGCACLLPPNAFTKTTGSPEMIDSVDGESGDVLSAFRGWSLDPNARVGSIRDQAAAGMLSSTGGSTVTLYAIWDDAPQFIVDAYPDRYFNLREARTGKITEEELLKTVVATDLETNPLLHKTAAEVEALGGDDVGITVHDYNSDDFTKMTDSGVITVTYKVKDEAKNVAFLRIRVNVAPTRVDLVEMVKRTRGISDTYASAEPDAGGLNADSLWRTDPTRSGALDRAMAADAVVSYCLDASAVDKVRKQVRDNGIGNSNDPLGLATTRDLLSANACT